MRISCLMLTYNKFPVFAAVVADAVESFRRQDYPDKELIILNDAPGQVLYLPEPQDDILVVNLPRRVRSLGEKCNLAASLATGDYLCRWDDDDIHLPWRLSYTAANLQQADYWKPARSFFLSGTAGRVCNGYMGACCINRAMFDRVQGYPFTGVGEDQAIEKRIRQEPAAKFVVFDNPVAKAFYIYRWGNGSAHVSGLGGDGYSILGRQPIVPGAYAIPSGWSQDYLQLRETWLHKEQTRDLQAEHQLSRRRR